MPYATVDFYVNDYLLGKKPVLPLGDFNYWESKASTYIEQYSLNRINEEARVEHADKLSKCVCELAEYLYINEGIENKTTESVSGHSASYIRGVEYFICQRHLGNLGLLYRGASL